MEKTEGIVLRALNYREKQRIITLFTKEAGIISLIVKRIADKNYALKTLISPLSCGEFIYTKGNSDLYRFEDGSLQDENLSLRTDWRHLEAAGVLAQAILRSQMPCKPDPMLYTLFIAYLKQVPLFEDHGPLLASFYLKLLHHEGLLTETNYEAFLHARSFNELRALTISSSDLQKLHDFFRDKIN